MNNTVTDAITRSVHDKFNCVTVNFARTQHGIFILGRYIHSIFA